MEWILSVLIAIDQLGNAICGGCVGSTISARVGYFSQKEHFSFIWYWKTLEWIIDFSFYPIAGPNHCLNAFENQKHKLFIRGSDFARIILSIIIVVVSIFISIVLRLAVVIIPSWHINSNQKVITKE